jgi:hypothetical protein
MRPTALPESTSETVVCETPARLATSTLVTLRALRDGAPVTGRELREFAAMAGTSARRASTCAVIRSTLVRMTLPFSLRSPSLLARSALLAVVLAGCAGTAASQDRAAAPATPRVAILAGSDAPDAAMVRATADAPAEVRRVDNPLDAQAAATALAGEGYDTVLAVGAQARAAVAQAAAGEVGDGTRWATH